MTTSEDDFTIVCTWLICYCLASRIFIWLYVSVDCLYIKPLSKYGMNISDVSIEEITLKSGVKSELIYFLVRSLFDRENNQANGSGGSRDDS